MDAVNRLNQLKQLKDTGAISEEQWAEQQAKEFARLQSAGSTSKMRKKPVCTACGLYREGHRIDICKKIQEERLRSNLQNANPQTTAQSQTQTPTLASSQGNANPPSSQLQVSSNIQGSSSQLFDLDPEELGKQNKFRVSFLWKCILNVSIRTNQSDVTFHLQKKKKKRFTEKGSSFETTASLDRKIFAK
jgi:hypothetical protein